MKTIAKVSLVLAVAAMMVGCGECYEKMLKKQDQIQVTCTPDVLSVNGGMVEADITVTFPEMYFNAETILKVTPVFVYTENGQAQEVACAPKYVQGEDVVGNYTAISRFEGGSYTQHISFPFAKRVEGTLELRIEAKCFDDCKETADFTPWATIAAASGVKKFGNPEEARTENFEIIEHKFERSSVTKAEAEIKYQINSSSVRKAQLSEEQVALFKDFVAANAVADRTTLSNIHASGYASPDGPEKFNNKLSERRSESGAKAIKKELKKVEGLNYEIASYGEDWDGFKALVEASDIEDKDLILNVLAMYSSPVERDQEIMNMSKVFKVLAEEILPQLRRTRFTVEATYAGLTDEEILAAAKANDTNLDIEHMLYAATLTNDLAEKTAIYTLAANTYGDTRAYNNLGVCLVEAGDINAAVAAFEKASSDVEAAGNVALIKVATGDLEGAKKYAASAQAEDAKTALGVIALAEGNYQEAKANLNGYSLAVAELADNNSAAAKEAINGVKGADADYVRAIIAVEEGDADKALAYLKSAIAEKPALKAEAENDIFFEEVLQNVEL